MDQVVDTSTGTSSASTDIASRPAPGEAGYLPVLPRGRVLFDSLPLMCLVLDQLPSVLHDGVIEVAAPGFVGAILVREDRVTEAHAFDGGGRVEGEEAFVKIRPQNEAAVSAHVLDPEVVACVGALLRGNFVYHDLRLEWADWSTLVRDLHNRSGTYIVEIDTPTGRGVTFVRGGRHIGSYTDAGREPGELGVLDGHTSARQGYAHVRHDPSGPSPSAATSEPEPAAEQEASSPASTEALFQSAVVAGEGTTASPEASEELAAAPAAEAESAPEWSEPGQAAPESENGESANGLPLSLPLQSSVGDFAEEFKNIARDRLNLSAASKVEELVDEAAREGRSVESLMASVRDLHIRGVMSSTLNDLAAEMESVALTRSA